MILRGGRCGLRMAQVLMSNDDDYSNPTKIKSKATPQNVIGIRLKTLSTFTTRLDKLV